MVTAGVDRYIQAFFLFLFLCIVDGFWRYWTQSEVCEDRGHSSETISLCMKTHIGNNYIESPRYVNQSWGATAAKDKRLFGPADSLPVCPICLFGCDRPSNKASLWRSWPPQWRSELAWMWQRRTSRLDYHRGWCQRPTFKWFTNTSDGVNDLFSCNTEGGTLYALLNTSILPQWGWGMSMGELVVISACWDTVFISYFFLS